MTIRAGDPAFVDTRSPRATGRSGGAGHAAISMEVFNEDKKRESGEKGC